MTGRSAQRVEFRSRPALMMGSVLSSLLVIGSVAMWIGLGAHIRSQFTIPQILTLLLFLGIIVGVMMAVGLSSIVCDDEGLHVRNALRTHHFAWNQVAGAELGEGDPWAYILVRPGEEHPDGESQMALAIQRSESQAQERMAELRAVIAAHQPSEPSVG